MTSSLRWIPVAQTRRVLEGIDDPVERTRAFAAITRVNILYMVSRAGSGHLGSSLSAADVVSWLLLHELRDPGTDHGDLYFSSKGHDAPGLYAALIGLGLLDEPLLHTLRRIDGLPGHPDVHTPHMPFNTGSLGMGIAKAKGVILADRLLGISRRVFVLTGDGELQEGQNWESLAGAAHRQMGELTVVVDHNQLQSDTWVADVSDLGDLAAKFTAFGWAVLRCDGNDVADLARTCRTRLQRYPRRPAVIIADTVKGAGCATFAATSMSPGERMYRFHIGAPAPREREAAYTELIDTAQQIVRSAGLDPLRPTEVDPGPPAPADDTPRLPEVYGRELVRHARRDARIVALDADLLLDTGLIPFAEQFPDRFVECGIAEQDMVSTAGGLARGGLLPFVHSFSCFLHARPNEQIFNNATEGRTVVYVGSLAGLLPAGPGHSHQAVRDVSALAAVPDLVILEPLNAAEVRTALDYCVSAGHSVYLRLVSVPVPDEVCALPAAPLELGRGRVLRSGGRVLAVGSGPVVLTELLRAADLLRADGIDLTVVALPWLNRVDPQWLAELAQAADHLIVVENHFVRGGQADLVGRALAELGLHRPPAFRGVGLTEVPRCGTAAEALRAHRLDAEGLADAVRAETGGKPDPGPLHVTLRH